MTRKGFDTSPLLDQKFEQASREYIKGVDPRALQEEPETLPELLIHTVKRIHRAPTATMMLAAVQKTQLSQKLILDVWEAMWERA